jgi:hypothetical protein
MGRTILGSSALYIPNIRFSFADDEDANTSCRSRQQNQHENLRQAAVAEMNIAGNHLQFWPKLAEVANDPWPYSFMRTPSLVFIDVVVSGV